MFKKLKKFIFPFGTIFDELRHIKNLEKPKLMFIFCAICDCATQHGAPDIVCTDCGNSYVDRYWIADKRTGISYEFNINALRNKNDRQSTNN